MRHRWRRLCCAFWLVLGALLLGDVSGRLPTVSAHANLVSAEPQAGAALTNSPASIHLTFSEPLDAGSSRLELRDSAGNVIVAGPGEIPADASDMLVLTLPPLADGIYTAAWRARSTVDGHVTEGSVPFAVGAGLQPPAPLPPPGTPAPTDALPTPLDAALRWIAYLATAQLVGALLFGLLVWRPALQALAEYDLLAVDRRVSQLLLMLIALAAAILLLATGLFALQEARQIASGNLGMDVSRLLTARSGSLLVLRGAAALVLLALPLRMPVLAETPNRNSWQLAAVICLPLLLSFSLYSHSAALGVVPLLVSLLHLTAMAAWLGGLLPLALALAIGRRSTLAATLVPRFSRVALTAVVVLAGTGIVLAGLHVQTWQALVGTTYGRALIGKSALFAGLVGLGAVNLLWLSPRLRQTTDRAARWVGRNARIEAALGVLLLMLAGVMMGSAPAATALAAQQRLGFRAAARQDDVRLVFQITPYRVGDNVFAVDVFDSRPGAQATPAQVLVRLRTARADLGEQEIVLTPEAAERFATRGSFLFSAGPWEAEVIVRRRGMDDVRQKFDLFPATASATGQASDSP